MKDPVILEDGQTYERAAIEEALQLKPESPITRQPMTMSSAKTNFALKSLIQRFTGGHLQQVPLKPMNELGFDRLEAEYDESGRTHISIKPWINNGRPPLCLIAVIDVSGSMKFNACESMKELENVEITRLQLVQHSLKTIVQCLSPEDSIEFITFNSKAKMDFPRHRMDKSGRDTAMRAISNFTAKGATNLWEALQTGIREARQQRDGSNISILLFTDGEPNQNPSMGIVPALLQELKGDPLDFTISTFSYGYKIDSQLLLEIAKIGNGVYGYCPDASMVGTIFINFMANNMTMLTQEAYVDIDGVRHDVQLYSSKQTDILVPLCAKAKLVIKSTNQEIPIPVVKLKRIDEIRDQVYRNKLIKMIQGNLESPERGKEAVQALADEIKKDTPLTDFMKALITDLVDPHPNHGQISKSFEAKYYEKWGKDYLRSFLRFHVTQLCGNFKDASLQGYSSPEFIVNRKIANKVFLSLPPPKARPKPMPQPRRQFQTNFGSSYSGRGDIFKNVPQLKSTQPSFTSSHGCGGWHQSSPSYVETRYVAPPPVRMEVFYCQGGGCFDGDSMVALKDGLKKVREIRKGDILKDGGEVVCLVETVVSREEPAVEYQGILFTPYHPIKVEGEWVFPRDIAETKVVFITSWFDMVLKGDKVINLNGVDAISLGHGMEGEVLSHPYFGTSSCVEALMKYEGFEEGSIRIEKELIPKRNEDGMIIEYF